MIQAFGKGIRRKHDPCNNMENGKEMVIREWRNINGPRRSSNTFGMRPIV